MDVPPPLALPPGVSAGHWTDEAARTGCTVVLLPPGTTASGEVRGGAPATREVALLAPTRTVDRIDAVVLAGGSAFGLAAADGVTAWLESQGRGWPTTAGPVPIVPTLGLYDLAVGDAAVRPDRAAGLAACEAATDAPLALGPVGAGTGCTVGGWLGPDHVRPAGLGGARLVDGDVVVVALMAVNAYGDVRDPDADPDAALRLPPPFARSADVALEQTTVGVVVTNAAVDKVGCHRLSVAAHDGMARALEPVHSAVDGDAVVVAATGAVPTDAGRLRALVVAAAEAAVRSGAGTRPAAEDPPRRP